MTEHFVDPDFEGTGYGYALDNGRGMDKQTRGCVALWCAVIEDAFRQSTAELRTWVMSNDFRLVCEMAGVQPSVIMVAARKLERGELSLRSNAGRPSGTRNR